MRYDIFLAWASVRSRPLQSLIPVLMMTAAIGLSITVLALSDGVQRGIIQASDPFGVLVVGPKGDSQQLVLNTILMQGLPLGTIPADIYTALSDDPRVTLAVPLAKGDNVGGAVIVGTNARFFDLRTDLNTQSAFTLAEGRLFAADFEAVLGAQAAASLGLSLGDTFHAAHGVEEGLDDDLHKNVYTVVGLLQPSGTPYDNAVYVTMESVWHEHEEEEENGLPPSSLIEEVGGHERLTAILVQPVGFVEQNQIWQEFYTRTDAQAVFPGQELGRLFDLMRQGEKLLGIVGILMLVMAGLTVFLSIYNAALSRERELAIMRSLGASRSSIVRMIIFETLLLTVIGTLIGHLVGYGLAFGIGQTVTAQSAVPVPIRVLTTLEPVVIAACIGLGIVAGLVPALMAYRVDVVDKLSGV